ncbi:hypothetical protein IJE86_03665 [bacterium]|nr:hypothetical protein [bacterium]
MSVYLGYGGVNMHSYQGSGRTINIPDRPKASDSSIAEFKKEDKTAEVVGGIALVSGLVAGAIVLAKKGKLGEKAQELVNRAWTNIKGVFSKKNTPTEKVVTPATKPAASPVAETAGTVVKPAPTPTAAPAAPSVNPAAKPPAAPSAKPAATSAATETAETATKFNFASKFKHGELKVVGDEAMKLLNGETLSPEKTQKAVKHLQKILQSGANDNFRQNILNCLNERFGTNYDLAHIPALKKILV